MCLQTFSSPLAKVYLMNPEIWTPKDTKMAGLLCHAVLVIATHLPGQYLYLLAKETVNNASQTLLIKCFWFSLRKFPVYVLTIKSS